MLVYLELSVLQQVNVVSNLTCSYQKYTAYLKSWSLPEMISRIAITYQAPVKDINVNGTMG